MVGVTKSEGGGSGENNSCGTWLLLVAEAPHGSLWTFLLLSTVAYIGGAVLVVLSPQGSENSAVMTVQH